jgi:hypothetical protein
MASRIPTTPIVINNAITIRLTAENYLYWRTQIVPILRSNLIYGFVDGTLPCPDAEIANTVAKEPATVPNPLYGAWHQQDQAILSAIVSSLTEGVIGMVMLAATSQEAWETLEVSYATQSTSRVMQLRTALSKCKKLDKSANAYFSEVKALADTMASVGQPLRPEEFNSYLLGGLDSDYDALADRIGARPINDPMPMRDVYAQMLNAEQRAENQRAELRVDVHHAANYSSRQGPGGSRAAPPPAGRTGPTLPGIQVFCLLSLMLTGQAVLMTEDLRGDMPSSMVVIWLPGVLGNRPQFLNLAQSLNTKLLLMLLLN